MIQIPQSTTRRVMLKLFTTGTTTAATGKTLAVVLSKAGGAFANPSAGATNATELSAGWYYVDLSTTDTGTLGDLIVRGTATGCDDSERLFGVVKATTAGLTALPDVAAGGNGGLPLVGSQIPNANANANGGLPILSVSGTTLAYTVSTLSTYTGNTPQTGDAYARIGLNGAGLSAIPDEAGVTTLLSRLTSARAGYFDNLNVGGAVASQADINALNQSASRRVTLVTVQQYERPESSTKTYQIEARTYDGDGVATNADTTPTLTATGLTSGSLAGNLSSATNPATGVYRWTYTVSSGDTLEQIRFDLSATISSATFTVATFAQVLDLVSATWTSTDASHLTAIFNKLPSKTYLTGTSNSDGDVQADEATGNFPGSVGSVGAGGITAASLAADCITAAKLAADVGTEIATAVNGQADPVEGFSPREFDRLILSAVTGLLSGATGGATTLHLRDVADTKDRLVIVIDAPGNRTSVTRNAT